MAPMNGVLCMKSPKKSKQAEPKVELVPNAWPKFEQFIRDVTKAGPQHRKLKPTRNRGKRASAGKREPSA